jgi:hypothetical protein
MFWELKFRMWSLAMVIVYAYTAYGVHRNFLNTSELYKCLDEKTLLAFLMLIYGYRQILTHKK